jgi:hypothetical protein
MSSDKRRWASPEQNSFLLSYFPEYLEAQSKGRYDKFWPKLFQEWFAKFPAPTPQPDDKTDSEPEPDADSACESDGSAESSPDTVTNKRKRTKTTKKKTKKRAKQVGYTTYYTTYSGIDLLPRWSMRRQSLSRRRRNWQRRKGVLYGSHNRYNLILHDSH